MPMLLLIGLALAAGALEKFVLERLEHAFVDDLGDFFPLSVNSHTLLQVTTCTGSGTREQNGLVPVHVNQFGRELHEADEVRPQGRRLAL